METTASRFASGELADGPCCRIGADLLQDAEAALREAWTTRTAFEMIAEANKPRD